MGLTSNRHFPCRPLRIWGKSFISSSPLFWEWGPLGSKLWESVWVALGPGSYMFKTGDKPRINFLGLSECSHVEGQLQCSMALWVLIPLQSLVSAWFIFHQALWCLEGGFKKFVLLNFSWFWWNCQSMNPACHVAKNSSLPDIYQVEPGAFLIRNPPWSSWNFKLIPAFHLPTCCFFLGGGVT